MFMLLVRGIVLGFFVAVPVGPIGLLVIRKTIAQGRKAGFVAGFGAATADAIYAAVAAFGLTSISGFLLHNRSWIQCIGAILLLYLAYAMIVSHPERRTRKKVEEHTLNRFRSSYFSTLFLTLTNPITIIIFAAVFAGTHTFARNLLSSTALVLGCFIGSAVWWFILTFTVDRFNKHISEARIIWINRVAGILIAILAIISLLGTLRHPIVILRGIL